MFCFWEQPKAGVYWMSIFFFKKKVHKPEKDLNIHFQLLIKGILTSDAVFAALGMNSSSMHLDYCLLLPHTIADKFHYLFMQCVSKSLPLDSFLNCGWNTHG